MKDFVHLHVHTEYSLLDGANKIDKLINQAVKLNMRSLAITDHGNLFGMIDFYDLAIKNGINPIIGEEFYLAKKHRTDKEKGNYHLVLLAKNQKGLSNLIKLSSIAFLEGFRYKPRIDLEVLKIYSEGLIGLSACRAGEIQKAIIENKDSDIDEFVEKYLDIFGQENFYLEMMRVGMEDDEIIIAKQKEIAKKFGIGYVATNDAHYLTRDDSIVHDVLLCIQTGSTLEDEDRWRFSSNEFYLKSKEEMNELFKDMPEALENTVKIAEMCNVKIDTTGKNIRMPKVEFDNRFQNDYDYFEYLAEKGLEKRFGKDISKEIKERYDFELKVIKEMNFAGYFIIIYNLVQMAKDNNISVGPGRGSAPGSLILYLLGITEINPLEYGLYFERFLNPQRVSMPDVDIDIADKDRDKLIDLLIDKYGKDNVAQIAAFGKLKSRQVFTDVARAFSMPPSEVKKITKTIPQNFALKDAYEESNEFKKVIDTNPRYKKIYEISLSLENNTRQLSKHAAGIVITPGPLMNFVPVCKAGENEKTSVTQFEKNALEKIGLVKIDVLGLRTLSVIDNILKLLKEKNIDIKLNEIELNDEKTFQLIKEANTIGVFQLESNGMRGFIRRYEPENFNDIIKIISFYRPGPMAGDQMSGIVKRKNGKEKIEYDHPILESILKDTYGYIIYQEQVMQIANKLAGFTFAEADILRKAMSKKKIDLMNKYREKFVEGARKKKIEPKIAEMIYEKISEFAKYGFNKSHGTAYAFLSYYTAYLKAHYPLEFMAATINSYMGNIKDIVKYIEEVKNMNIPILPPDINKSDYYVTVEEDALRLGLGIIKNVGESAVRNIIINRKEGEYENIYDFLERVDNNTVNKKAMESLIKAGAFDSFKMERGALYESLSDLTNKVSISKKDKEKGLINLFEETESDDWKELIKTSNVWDKETKLNYEFEVLEFFISGHPLDKYRNLYESFISHKLDEFEDLEGEVSVRMIGIISNASRQKSRRGNQYANFRLFTIEGYIEAKAFQNVLEKYGDLIKNDKIVLIEGKTVRKDEKDKPQIIAELVIPIEKISDYIYALEMNIEENKIDDIFIEELENILSSYSGKNYFLMNIKGRDSTVRIKSKKFLISANNTVFKKLQEIAGDGNLKYRFKKFR